MYPSTYFLSNLYLLQLNTNDALDFIIDFIENCLQNEDFDTLNTILNTLNVYKYNITSLLAILTMTLSAKTILGHSRYNFYLRVREFLLNDPEHRKEVHELLQGLN